MNRTEAAAQNLKRTTYGIDGRIMMLRGHKSRSLFAAQFGVSLDSIVRYESKKTMPNAAFIAALCNHYDVTADWLIFGEDKNSNQFDQSAKQNKKHDRSKHEKPMTKKNIIIQLAVRNAFTKSRKKTLKDLFVLMAICSYANVAKDTPEGMPPPYTQL